MEAIPRMIPIWLKILGPIALIAAVVAGFRIYIHRVATEARQEVRAEVKAAQDAQTIADLEKTLAEERSRAVITETKNEELAPALADARARLASYVQRMRGAPQGGGSGAGVSQAAGGTDVADSTDPRTLVPLSDLDACAENTVRLKNAQGWWREQQSLAEPLRD